MCTHRETATTAGAGLGVVGQVGYRNCRTASTRIFAAELIDPTRRI